MVSQEFHGEFVRKNVVENLNTIFSYHESFSQKLKFKMVPYCLGALTSFYCCDN
jgi:hypothetical protein